MNKKLLKITIIGIVVSLVTMSVLTLAWLNSVIDLLHTAELEESQQIIEETQLIVEETQKELETFEATASVITKIEYKDPELEYLGNFTITYYDACVKCCGNTLGITASGAHVQENHTIAVDPKVIPLGSKVMIRGIVYTAEDTGSAVKGNHIDIYVPTHEEACELGLDYADVYLLK